MLDYDNTTYKQVFEAADKVYTSARQISVAAVSLDETQSAFEVQNQPQVAACEGRGGQQGGCPAGCSWSA